MDFTSVLHSIGPLATRKLLGEEAVAPVRMLKWQKRRSEMQGTGQQAAAAQSASTNTHGSDETQDLENLDAPSPTDMPDPPGGDGLWSQISDFFEF